MLGFDLCLSENGGHWVYYLGFYELGTLDIIRQCLRPGDTFVDVGSSIGLMTNVGAVAVGAQGRVIAIEPDSERFTCMLTGLSINSRENVEAIECALGANPGVGFLYRDRKSPSLVRYAGSKRGERVKTARLDDVLEERCATSVRLIKIDVEGYEAEVIEGAQRTLQNDHAPILCVERNLSLPVQGDDPNRALRTIADTNEYSFYQLQYTSHTVSRLRAVSTVAELHPNDNVFCLTPRHCASLPRSLFT